MCSTLLCPVEQAQLTLLMLPSDLLFRSPSLLCKWNMLAITPIIAQLLGAKANKAVSKKVQYGIYLAWILCMCRWYSCPIIR